MSTRTRSDWILWAQLGCALVATAHAEYTLVSALGQSWVVAGAVTGALDLYVVRALQKHKDVLPAVLVMVAANVVSILISHDVVPVHWAVLAAVGALAPLLVWRGHRLRVHRVRDAGAVSAPEYAVPVPEYVALGRVPVFSANEYGCTHNGYCRDANGVQVIECPEPSAPDVVPDWMADEYPPSAASPVPYLAAVPDLPAEYAPELSPGDAEYVALAQEYVDAVHTPSVRGLKAYASVGQARAERLLKHLGVKS